MTDKIYLGKFKLYDVWIDGNGNHVRIVSITGDGLNKKWPIVGHIEVAGVPKPQGIRLYDANGIYDLHEPYTLISKLQKKRGGVRNDRQNIFR